LRVFLLWTQKLGARVVSGKPGAFLEGGDKLFRMVGRKKSRGTIKVLSHCGGERR